MHSFNVFVTERLSYLLSLLSVRYLRFVGSFSMDDCTAVQKLENKAAKPHSWPPQIFARSSHSDVDAAAVIPRLLNRALQPHGFLVNKHLEEFTTGPTYPLDVSQRWFDCMY